MSKKKWKMGEIFVAFSEYLNFTKRHLCTNESYRDLILQSISRLKA